MEQPTVRPTLRTLHALNIKLPDAYTSLADLEHPVVVKSQSVPIQVHAGGGERFLAITDRLWWKVKVNRWRAAVVNASGEDSWWIGMAGLREDGSKTDFYAKHANLFKRHGNSEPWLPQVDDYKREAIEKHLAYWPKLRKMLERALVRSTYQPNGVAVGVTLNDNGRIGYLVEVHDELLLVGCVIEHTVNYRIGALAREIVPGASVDDWEAEPVDDGFGVTPGSGQMLFRTFISAKDLEPLLERHSDVGLD